MNRRLAVLVIAATLGPGTLARGQSDYILEPSPSLASAGVPRPLAELLTPEGSRLVRTAGGAHAPICDVWWVKSVPTVKPAGSSPDILENNIQAGTLMGLLQFLSPDAEDFRDQKLKPGLYTMRYAQIPQDGNHMGVSQYRDFLLLSPVGADAQVGMALSFDDLLNLSRRASGTSHPAVMSLAAANPAYKKLPAVVADDQGNCSIQALLHETSAAGVQEMAVALVLITPAKEGGGS
ncbi:MAG TPA: hypothetical protein VL523_20320 [Terriglobia bacterium]|nr:hypothetical protein [Terriglobia bacterium]